MLGNMEFGADCALRLVSPPDMPQGPYYLHSNPYTPEDPLFATRGAFVYLNKVSRWVLVKEEYLYMGLAGAEAVSDPIEKGKATLPHEVRWEGGVSFLMERCSREEISYEEEAQVASKARTRSVLEVSQEVAEMLC
eukprot:TRINITY_DN11344_c0_g2_i1.p1 TRINITY_DN11344_c0_g2~~TRINITY_DN11344_c0_g2_i1.p1  ORF type:complete len:136 (+),score=20.94 TRINITY_DN11344_c0_g2_i1:161-568(+)